MRRTAMLAAAAAATLLLAGCAAAARDTSADPTLPAKSSATQTTTAAPAGPQKSPRGNIVKALGQEGGYCSDTTCTGPMAVTFTIDAITVDPKCTSDYPQPPENGHLIAVAVRASTSPNMPSDIFPTFGPSDFRVVGPDGLTVSNLATGASFSCLPQRDQFTQNPLGPGQQYAGSVVLDSPAASGVLIYAPGGVSNGWEWQF